MDFYEQYKPFRNYIRNFEIVDSLNALKHILLFLQEDTPLPSYFCSWHRSNISLMKNHIHSWEIEILIREVILNGNTYGTKTLSVWNHFYKAIEMLQKIENLAATVGSINNKFDNLELDRIIHRQIIWQNDPEGLSITKASMVFGEKTLRKLIEEEYGLGIEKILLLMIISKSMISRNIYFDTSTNFDYFSINQEQSCRIFEKIIISLKDLKENLRLTQQYNENWAYTWNPLISNPLIILDSQKRNHVICPIPMYLLRRSTSGIFYDLVNNERFTNSFGASFENFVGEIINTACDKERFSVTKIKPYTVNKSPRHGVDWILSDESANLFIETKTKRLTLQSKTTIDPQHMDKYIKILAEAIVQNYKNIKDIYNGLTNFNVNDLPSYSMIITMEDWYFVNPYLSQRLFLAVTEKMKVEHINIEYLDKYPFSVLSSNEFEYACQAIGIIGIKNCMDRIIYKGKFEHSIIPRASRIFSDLNVKSFLFSEHYDSIWKDEIIMAKKKIRDRR